MKRSYERAGRRDNSNSHDKQQAHERQVQLGSAPVAIATTSTAPRFQTRSSTIAKKVRNAMVRTVERHETGYAFAR